MSTPEPEKTQPISTEIPKLCNVCGFACPEYYEFCGKCGKPLPNSEAEKPTCKNKKCGYVNPKGATTCCMCGESLSNRSLTKQDLIDFLWDVVIYGFLLQFIVTYQNYITNHIFSVEGFEMCIAFSILPSFANLYKKKRGVKLQTSQQEIEIANNDIREDNYKQREQYIKEREKNLQLEERIKQLESGGK